MSLEPLPREQTNDEHAETRQQVAARVGGFRLPAVRVVPARARRRAGRRGRGEKTSPWKIAGIETVVIGDCRALNFVILSGGQRPQSNDFANYHRRCSGFRPGVERRRRVPRLRGPSTPFHSAQDDRSLRAAFHSHGVEITFARRRDYHSAANSASTPASTDTPLRIASDEANSSGRWLTPPRQGMKIMPTGHTRAMNSVSW